jgi:hypothetical protein
MYDLCVWVWHLRILQSTVAHFFFEGSGGKAPTKILLKNEKAKR